MSVFIHGFGTNGKIWDNNQPEAKSLGSGMVSPDLDLSNLDQSVSLLRSLTLDPCSLTLVAWSMGAWVAIKYYLENPSLVKKLILVSATPKFLSSNDFPAGLSPALFRNLERKLNGDYEDGMKYFHGLIFNGKIPAGIQGLAIPPTEKALAAMQTLKTYDLRDQLSKIEIPVLLVHGNQDQIVPVEAAYYLRDHLKNAKLEIFEGCGHAPFIEQPERFKELIDEFIR